MASGSTDFSIKAVEWIYAHDATNLGSESLVVDGLTRLWFTLVFQRGLGRRLAFKVLRER